MTTDTRLLGTLRAEDGAGAVRMEDCVAADVDDVWAALTDRARLGAWLGDFEGDLSLGGEYRARYHASGWEGTRRVTAWEPPHHLRNEHENGAFEVWLTADGDHTHVVWEERGMPVEQLFAYGAGIQIHVEDLAAYLAGREIDHSQAGARWEALSGPYQELARRNESA